MLAQGIEHRFHDVIDVTGHLSRWEIEEGRRLPDFPWQNGPPARLTDLRQ